MNKEELIRAYLRGLEIGKCKEILELFTNNATVSSPLYGEIAANVFYSELFEDTSDSKIELHDIFVKVSDSNKYAAHFHYDWKLKNGERVSFRCIDIFEFDEDTSKIKHLLIIYDSKTTREAFDELHGKI